MKVFLFGICALFLIGTVYLLMNKEEENSLPVTESNTEQVPGRPTFVWSYRESERDGIPYSEITLTANYDTGVHTSKSIDTIEGGCNVYESTDSDVYDQSSMIICYYAGLGRYYKVIAEGNGYAVQRKIFEEASPDYNPPSFAYETIVRF